MGKWPENDRLRALAIAEASTIQEASKQTGIPEPTIKAWRKRMADKMHASGHATLKKADAITAQAMEEAKEEVKQILVNRSMQVAEKLMAVNELAVDYIRQTIEQGPNPDEPKSAWLRALVGAMAQGVEKHQLLDGKPTQRQEVSMSDGDDHKSKLLEDLRRNLADIRQVGGLESEH